VVTHTEVLAIKVEKPPKKHAVMPEAVRRHWRPA
jgi:hypothetical protein